jgi:hypothetical protein
VSDPRLPLFPARDADGNFEVGARFRLHEGSRRPPVEAIISAEIRRREVDDGAPPFTGEFRQLPTEEWGSQEDLEVVFAGGATSRVWKDWMVALIAELTTHGLDFEGVVDRVSGRTHP